MFFNIRYIVLAFIITMSMAQIGHVFAGEGAIKDILRLTTPKARVTQVIDGQTLVVNNTTTIHLPAIYIPWETPTSQGKYGKRAKEFLETEFLDKFVRIYQVRNIERALFNALGHKEAYLVRADDGLWAQEELVKFGYAFAYPTQSHKDTVLELYKAEEFARGEKIGFWAEDQWKILNEDTAIGVEDRFAIIEGVIEKIAVKNNVIYLNFGDDWRKDMTVAMDSLLRRQFSKAGINVTQLAGQKIRARGWIRDYNGPFIEIFDPSQIEIIN
jgi:micrococcal nuclease